MPISPADGEQYAREIRRIYAQAERDTISMLADTLGSDTYREDWAQLKLRQLEDVRGRISSEVIDELDVDDKVRDAVEKAYRDGSDAAIADLRKVKRKGADIGDINTGFGTMNRRAIDAAAQEAVGNLQSTHIRILRQADDVYRKAVSEAQTSVLTGTATRREASQKVLNKFANQGVTGFIDDAGRSWNLSSYSEMAVRTSTGRSAVNGHLDRMQQNGRDLVSVSDHAEECPLCRPWEGRVLSISGQSSDYPSVDAARSAGLFHPNCRHTLGAYISGLTNIPQKTKDSSGYKLRQQQRYNERGIRKWKRRKSSAMDDETEQYAQSKISAWQEKQRELVNSTDDLKRLYYREQIDQAR